MQHVVLGEAEVFVISRRAGEIWAVRTSTSLSINSPPPQGTNRFLKYGAECRLSLYPKVSKVGNRKKMGETREVNYLQPFFLSDFSKTG